MTNRSRNELQKLNHVNRLLYDLQHQTPERSRSRSKSRLLFSASSSTSTNTEKWVGGGEQCLGNSKDDDESCHAGIFVTADHDLSKGTNILTCQSEGFVLERPEDRLKYCSYCCSKNSPSPTEEPPSSGVAGSTNFLTVCADCRDHRGNSIVGYCSNCADLHERLHVNNAYSECSVLQCLVSSITSTDQDNGRPLSPEEEITNQVIYAILESSVALLTLRLVCRKACTITADLLWWNNFQLLHEHPLQPGDPFDNIATVLASALDAVQPNAFNAAGRNGNDNSTKSPGKNSFRDAIATKAIVGSTLGKILGCSHAIVDPSLPLGKQTLGRAVFVGHSFYNHSCEPNAYLSASFPEKYCSIVTSLDSHRHHTISANGVCGLAARVHLLREVPKGQEITLSYLPLSGLSMQERQQTLAQGYGFRCQCRACTANSSPKEQDKSSQIGESDRDNNETLTLPTSYDFQAHSTAPIDSIREIQFGLNDRLLELQKHNRRSSTRPNKCKDITNKDEEDRRAMRDELEDMLATIAMTQRGIRNQNLPESHEVSIESNRLAAAAYDALLQSIYERDQKSIEYNENLHDDDQDKGVNDIMDKSESHHEEFFRKVSPIQELFDPVALGVQHLAYSKCMHLCRYLNNTDDGKAKLEQTATANHEGSAEDYRGEKAKIQYDAGMEILRTCLGQNHPWIQSLLLEKTLLASQNRNTGRFCAEMDHSLIGIDVLKDSRKGEPAVKRPRLSVDKL